MREQVKFSWVCGVTDLRVTVGVGGGREAGLAESTPAPCRLLPLTGWPGIKVGRGWLRCHDFLHGEENECKNIEDV